MSKSRISYERLRELVNYDPGTGIMTRKIRTSNRVHIGDVVGTIIGNGYWLARVDKHLAYNHQFAWLYAYGEWPESHIDHVNGDITDNRLVNLRLATVSQNQANKKRPSHNTSGYKGVWKKRQRWCAEIKKDGVKMYLGTFDDPLTAHAAYVQAAQKLFGEFARVA